MSEVELIKKCQSGYLRYFGDIYDMYIDKIYRFIYLKTSDQQVAEDITSEVFMKAVEKIPNFDIEDGGSLQAWLYTIAYHKVVDYYRSHRGHTRLEDMSEYQFYKTDDYAKLIDDDQKVNEVRKFLDSLNPIHAEIVLLRIWEQLSYSEISEITGKNIDNCKQIFRRSIRSIQDHIVPIIIMIFLI